MFQTEIVQKIKTHISCLITFFKKLSHLRDNARKYRTAGQATDDSMMCAMRLLDN
jgi:hypothetical protein